MSMCILVWQLKIKIKEEFFSIFIISRDIATITITTATPERTFSSLGRIKNYMRSTMSEDRLNDLAILYIHTPIDVDEIVNRFSRQKPRRMQMEDWLNIK